MATMERVGDAGVERSEKVIVGSSITELIAGAAAVVLPILGLVGVLPMTLAAIAFIAIGGGMMIQGGALSSQSKSLLGVGNAGTLETTELIGGLSADVLGGAATSALGILALVGIAPVTLLAVASIVTGGALVLAAGTTSRLSSLRYGSSHLDDTKRQILRESVKAAAGADVLVGLSSVVLGILVLANVGGAAVHVTLVLVAALALGGALFLNGTAVGARIAALLS